MALIFASLFYNLSEVSLAYVSGLSVIDELTRFSYRTPIVFSREQQ